MTRQPIFWALVFSVVTTVCEAEDWRYKVAGSSGAPAAAAEQATVSASDEVASTAQVDSASTAAQPAGPMPPNNMVLVKVREQFGDPQEEIPAVGEPPILRWKYPSYITYFEVDRVIISVPLDQ